MGAIQVPFYSKHWPTSLISIESYPQVIYFIEIFPRRIIKLNLKHHKACQQSHFASGHSPCHSFGSCIIAFFVLKNVANFRQENKSCPPWSLDLTTLVKESDSAVPLCSDITYTNPPTDSPANAAPYCSIVSRLCSSVRQPKVN